MGALLLILQIIGALPGVINFLKMLWEKIKEIRDKRERDLAKKHFKSLVFRRQNLRKMSIEENESLLNEAKSLYYSVEEIIKKENVV
jgi:hypothetical protein